MRKVVFLRIVLLCLLAGWVNAQPADKSESIANLKLVGEFEGGKLYEAGKLNVLELRGSFRQMGRQEGGLLKDQLPRFYEAAITERMVKKHGLSLERIKAAAQYRFGLYPQRFKEIPYGIAETSGMDVDKLALLNYLWSLALYTPRGHCSAMAAWGEYTAGGPLVFGRNLDYPAYFKDFAEFLTLVVYNPEDGIPATCFGYAGQVATANGMNRAGLFIELNDGSLSGGSVACTNRVTVSILSLGFLLDCSSMRSLDAAINTTKAHYAFIFNAADKDAAYCYEWPIFDVKRRAADRSGLLVATNHFVDPSWGLAIPTHDSQTRSVQRYKNLLALGDQYKGKFDEKKMMDIFDTPFDKGGVTWPDRTIYQMVAVPQELRLWLKAPGYQDWVLVDLAKLFTGRER